MSRSLSDVAIGDPVQIRDICFELIRTYCGTVGIRPGTRVRPISSASHELVLETPSGARIGLDRFYACFVDTTPCEDIDWRRPDARASQPPTTPAPDLSSLLDLRVGPYRDVAIRIRDEKDSQLRYE